MNIPVKVYTEVKRLSEVETVRLSEINEPDYYWEEETKRLFFVEVAGSKLSQLRRLAIAGRNS